jgi:type I restriction enzyme S subunit
MMVAYEKYRPAGLPWLAEIPAHWSICRNGQLFSQRSETGCGELPILEVSLKTSVQVRNMDNPTRKQVMSDQDKYKRSAQGDIAYNMMRMWQGAVGVVPVDGLVSPAYVVAQPFPDVNARFFVYLFRTNNYMEEINAYSRGIVKDRNRLYWQDFKGMPSVAPPRDEQDQIVRFLDWKVSKINRLINNLKKQITLLNEQKQAIINKAVTRGGDGWEWYQLGKVVSIILSGLDKKNYEGQKAIKLCNYVDVYKNNNITGDLPFMEATASDNEIANLQLQVDDVIITKDSESWDDIGVPAYVKEVFDGLCCGYHLAILRSQKDIICGEFLYNAFRAQYVQIQHKVKANGVTRFALGYQPIHDTQLFIPSIEEQLSIVQYIRESCAVQDKMLANISREISLITEYRTRLISDVVTGKLDVRDVVVPEFETMEEVMVDGEETGEMEANDDDE